MRSILRMKLQLLTAATLMLAAATAQSQAVVNDGSVFSGMRFSISESVWLATWDPVLQDAQVVVPTATNVPVAQVRFAPSNSSTKPLYITAVSINKGSWVVTASASTTANYEHSLSPDGVIARREWDASVGYILSPNLVASVIYKAGRISQGSSVALIGLGDSGGEYILKGFGAGLTYSAPLNLWSDSGEPTRLKGYGSFAYARGHVDLGTSNPAFDYRISEIGLLYALGTVGQVGTVTAKVGYRSQIVNEKGLDVGTYSLAPPYPLLSSQKMNFRSTTDGMILGLTLTF